MFHLARTALYIHVRSYRFVHTNSPICLFSLRQHLQILIKSQDVIPVPKTGNCEADDTTSPSTTKGKKRKCHEADTNERAEKVMRTASVDEGCTTVPSKRRTTNSAAGNAQKRRKTEEIGCTNKYDDPGKRHVVKVLFRTYNLHVPWGGETAIDSSNLKESRREMMSNTRLCFKDDI